MTEQNRDILNAIPLVEVMRGWGHVPRHEGDDYAAFICPWHDDHRPSLQVRKKPIKDATDLSFKCWACGEQGFGAVQLAARLMGLPAGKVADEEIGRVYDELITRCDVELQPEENGGGKHYDTRRKSVVGWKEFHEQEKQYADWTGEEPIMERGEWTEQGLKALGLKVELATRRAKHDDVAASRNNDITLSRNNENSQVAAIRIGDLLTEYDKGSVEPLYRCSLGRDFYRGAKFAETRTIAGWGEELERLFHVEPVSRFIYKKVPEKGGAVARIVRATANYPIFMFRYPWGMKKYEPKDVYGENKWTWWCVKDDADLYHQWYADAALEDVLTPGTAVPENDERHPYVEQKDKDGKPTGKVRFERVVLCSGPRDAIAVWSHSNAHVVWLHSEQAGFDKKGGSVRPNRWLRSLLRKLQGVTVGGGLYVCYDEDATGLEASQAIALNSPNIHWLRLPKELTGISVGKTDGHTKRLKDITDFVTRFQEVEGRMPADLQHDDPVEWFDNALFDTPTCKFWQWESERKDADGTGRARYKFDLRNTPVFLRARGLVRKEVQQGKVSFSRFFMLHNDHTYTEVFPGANGSNRLVGIVRDCMAEWLRAHKEYNDEKGALSRSIYSAKLEQGVLNSIEQVDFDDKSFGEDFDHFFFSNTAVMVTKDKIVKVPYSSMKWWTNRECILDGNFETIPQSWHVIVNPLYEPERQKHEDILQSLSTTEERQQENMRWDAWVSLWQFRLVLDRPLEEMPLHFRFLYNLSSIFWEKEETAELTATEKQMQDMYFIVMLHAIGSAIVRYRSANRQQWISITDNSTRREDLASGGTGKTILLELLGLVRRMLKIDGKSLEDGKISLTQELDKVVAGMHNLVGLDETPKGFSPKSFYNYTLSMTSRGLYRESVVLEGDDLPKIVVTSNEYQDLSSDSTSRRVYQILVGDWYHPRSLDGSRPAHTPADDFRKEYGIKEVARNLPQKYLNEAWNLLLGCAQLFFQFPDVTIQPPKDSRALLRQALAASKDEQFTRWIASYLADKRHIGTPIAQRELAISLLDYCGIVVGEKTLKAAYKRIRDNMDDYLRTSVFVVDPPVVLLTDTDHACGYRQCAAWQYPRANDGYSIATDEHGNRLKRELKTSKRVYYFYRKGKIPFHRFDEAHIGDKDYVQPAPEKDPEESPKS